MCSREEKKAFTAGWASVMAVLLIQFGTAIWWASTTDERISHLVTREEAAQYQAKVEWNYNQLTNDNHYTQEEAEAAARFEEYRYKALLDAITELKLAIKDLSNHTH